MYQLNIYLPVDDKKSSFGLGRKGNVYYLPSTDEVCKVLQALSHLKPCYTLESLSLKSSDEVLKDFELYSVNGELEPIENLSNYDPWK